MKNISDEQFIKTIKQCNTIHEVLMTLGLNTSSGAYKSFKKRVLKLDIDISHFLTKNEIMSILLDKGKIIKKTNDEIFTENSKVSRSTVKNRLLTEGILNHECVECGNVGIWMGKKISLILDHINGVNNDNRIENLRLLCPNCNATLETHCVGSNKKKEKIDKRTIPQDRTHLRKIKNRPSKEQLLQDVKEFGYRGTGRKYGVSDNAIRKWLNSVS